MSTTTLIFRHYVSDALTNATSVVLSSSDTTYGVKRADNDDVVVADGTAMTLSSTGVYVYTLTDPAADLTYDYSVEVVYSGITTFTVGQEDGTVSSGSSDDLTVARQNAHDNADYAESSSLTKARAYVSACEQMIIYLPMQSATGGGEEVRFQVEQIEKGIARAKRWIGAHDTTSNPRHRYFSIANLRSG